MKEVAWISVIWFKGRELKEDWGELRFPEGEPFRERFARVCRQIIPMCKNFDRGINTELGWRFRLQQFVLALNVGRETTQNMGVPLKTIKSDRDLFAC